ncbi:MAG: hypothetical protein CVU09_08395 [Bacteroidetes bacterium HGW-Bacteroidetes-4]|jgi:hypothetical protein|nr:MAG: hypothetical protein CVU09_08395 [Bacteroidetes bacterium HGW-Bacteroidetes-4]
MVYTSTKNFIFFKKTEFECVTYVKMKISHQFPQCLINIIKLAQVISNRDYGKINFCNQQ